MAEQTQVLSMQMVSCEERLARAETDLRVERECRNALQTREVQLKEQITGFKLEIRELMADRQKREQLQKELDVLKGRYVDSERTLEELGMQLSVSKLQIVDLKEKHSKRVLTSGGGGGGLSGDVMNTSVLVEGQNNNSSTWTPDKLVSECRGCNKEFSMTRRKHHCRNCGNIYCNNCSDHVAPLPVEGGHKPVRVCDNCWVQLNST